MNNLKLKLIIYLKTQNWQRIGAMLLVGIFAIGVAVYFSDNPSNDVLLNTDTVSQNKNTSSVLTTDDNPNKNSQINTSEVALKDPFKVPEKFKALPPAQIATAPGSPNPGNKNSVASEIPKIKLTGIVGSGATREAIVEVGGKSRSYKKMDMIIGSPYQLIYMTASAAVFRDSRGEKITLTIGR